MTIAENSAAISMQEATSLILGDRRKNSHGQTKLDVFNQIFSDQAMKGTAIERFGKTISEAFPNLSVEDVQRLREDGIRRLALANVWEIEAALFHNALSYANIERRDRRITTP